MNINKKIITIFSLFLIFIVAGMIVIAHQSSRRYKNLKHKIASEQIKLANLEEQIAEQNRLVSLLAIGNSIDNSFLNTNDTTLTAKTLCDVVYRETLMPTAKQVPILPTVTTSTPPYEVYKNLLKNKKFGQACFGHAYLLISMLEAKGIPARAVGMVKAIEYSADSHATVEFYNGSKWLALDPTFNIMWQRKDTNEFLSYSELYDAYKADIMVEPIFIGTEKNPRKTIENYYIDTKELMGYLAVAPPTVFTSEGPLYFQAEVRPHDWDGYQTVKDKPPYNRLEDVSTFYQYITSHVR